MKRFSSLLLVAVLFAMASLAQTTRTLTSPNGKLKTVVTLADGITYDVFLGDELVMDDCRLSLNVGGNVLGSKPQLKQASQKSVNEIKKPFLRLKYAEVPNVYNELTLKMKGNYSGTKTLTFKIKENAPEGYNFLQWVMGDGSVIPRKMPAFGLDLYAQYTKTRILLYVDYNNNRVDEEGNALPLSETMKVSPFLTNNPIVYGDDVEAVPNVETGEGTMGVGTMVKRDIITDGNRPGENYEVVAWNIYHVENGKDVFDKANWKPGINDEGTNNAYTTLIYQPEWKHHTEFFFRIYTFHS